MPLNIAQRGIKSTFERAIKEQIDYVEILFMVENHLWHFNELRIFANGYGRKSGR